MSKNRIYLIFFVDTKFKILKQKTLREMKINFRVDKKINSKRRNKYGIVEIIRILELFSVNETLKHKSP